jgi:hypothetical protein
MQVILVAFSVFQPRRAPTGEEGVRWRTRGGSGIELSVMPKKDDEIPAARMLPDLND